MDRVICEHAPYWSRFRLLFTLSIEPVLTRRHSQNGLRQFDDSDLERPLTQAVLTCC